MKKNVLVTGGSGLLGRHVIGHAMTKPEVNTYFPSHEHMNIVDYKSVYNYVKEAKLDLIIHCAAMIGLDRCENNKQEAYKTNVAGTGIICRVADQFGISVVVISTDYVFDGTQGSYSEECVPNPIGFYAKTKWAGECIALSYSKHVIRTSFHSGMWQHDKAFSDKWTSFDNVEVISSLVLESALKHSVWRGILHVGTERKTFYEYAKRNKPDVQPMSLKEVKVHIPPDTSFDNSKMREILHS